MCKETGKCDPYPGRKTVNTNKRQAESFVRFSRKDFKAAIISMLKELKEKCSNPGGKYVTNEWI